MILYIEDAQNPTKRLLELITKVSITTEYKVNTQKPIAFLYTNNKLTEREIRKTTPFIIASRKKKYFEINLTKEVENLYTENYSTL